MESMYSLSWRRLRKNRSFLWIYTPSTCIKRFRLYVSSPQAEISAKSCYNCCISNQGAWRDGKFQSLVDHQIFWLTAEYPSPVVPLQSEQRKKWFLDRQVLAIRSHGPSRTLHSAPSDPSPWIFTQISTISAGACLVMCRLGSAWKPPAKLSFPRPRPSKSEAWAVLVGLGQLRLSLGSGHGLWEIFWHTIESLYPQEASK